MSGGKGIEAILEVVGGEAVGKAIQAPPVGGHVSLSVS
jgi:hypothetical protein